MMATITDCYCFWNPYIEQYERVPEWFNLETSIICDSQDDDDLSSCENFEVESQSLSVIYDCNVPKPLNLSSLPTPPAPGWVEFILKPEIVAAKASEAAVVAEDKLHTWTPSVAESWEPTMETLGRLCSELAVPVPHVQEGQAVMDVMIRLCCPAGQPRNIYTLMKMASALTPSGRSLVKWWSDQPQPSFSDLCKAMNKPVPEEYKDTMKKRDLMGLVKRMVTDNVPPDFSLDTALINGSLQYGYIISAVEAYRRARRGNTRLLHNSQRPVQQQNIPGPQPNKGNASHGPHSHTKPGTSQDRRGPPSANHRGNDIRKPGQHRGERKGGPNPSPASTSHGPNERRGAGLPHTPHKKHQSPANAAKK